MVEAGEPKETVVRRLAAGQRNAPLAGTDEVVVALLVGLTHERLAREPVASSVFRTIGVAQASGCGDAETLFLGTDGALGTLPVGLAELEQDTAGERADLLLRAVEVFEAVVRRDALGGRSIADLAVETVAVDAALADREATVREALFSGGAVRVLGAGADELAEAGCGADVRGRAVADVFALDVDEAVSVETTRELARAVVVIVALNGIDALSVLARVVAGAIVAGFACGAANAATGIAGLADRTVAVAEADATPSADTTLDAEEAGCAVEVPTTLDLGIGLGTAREVADSAGRAIRVPLALVRRSGDADAGDTTLGARAVV